MARWLILGDPDWAPLQAFRSGLRLIGVDAVLWVDHRSDAWSGHDCDAVAIYGLRAQGQDVLAHYRSRGIPVVVIDHGYMARVNTIDDIATGHFQIGVDRLGWTPRQAPSSDRFDALGIQVQQRAARPIRRAVIMGQVGFDASHRQPPAALTACYEALGEELQRAGVRSVVFRRHPLGQGIEPRLPQDGPRPIEDAIAAADLIVSLNSNAGVDALIQGCPVATLMDSHYGELAFRWPVRLAAMAPPSAEAVTAYLHRLAYAQWTAAEIAAGQPHRFLQSIGAIPC